MPPVAAEQLRKVFKGHILVVDGFDANSAEAIIEKGIADLVDFGRSFFTVGPTRLRAG
jgi:N-ethylmaleimide reductase